MTSNSSNGRVPDREIDIAPAIDRIADEREARLKDAHDLLKTGVPFLDITLRGLRKSDLMLIGAKSGAGKTELISSITEANCIAGKRVHAFILEGEQRELERRIKYRLMAKAFFADKEHPQIPISYAEWMHGELDDIMEPYETQAEKLFYEKFKNLTTIYRRSEFGIRHFETIINSLQGKTDLVIVDHLNYFDLDEGANENRAVTQTMMKIRDLALIHRLPVILVAHVRKKDRGSKAIMPDLEEFMGSSNIYKIATQSVLLAPAPKIDKLTPFRWPTFMRAAKYRIDGSITRYVARCIFNSERNEYESGYQLGHWFDGMESFVPISDLNELPRWARRK